MNCILGASKDNSGIEAFAGGYLATRFD